MNQRQQAILDRIKALEVDCPECLNANPSGPKQCYSCGNQGQAIGKIRVYEFLEANFHLLPKTSISFQLEGKEINSKNSIKEISDIYNNISKLKGATHALPFDLMSRKLAEMTEEVLLKKTDIFFEKLKCYGIRLNKDNEASKRFKSIHVETFHHKEEWYYNDGTEEGLLVVTFTPKEEDFTRRDLYIGFEYF